MKKITPEMIEEFGDFVRNVIPFLDEKGGTLCGCEITNTERGDLRLSISVKATIEKKPRDLFVESSNKDEISFSNLLLSLNNFVNEFVLMWMAGRDEADIKKE